MIQSIIYNIAYFSIGPHNFWSIKTWAEFVLKYLESVRFPIYADWSVVFARKWMQMWKSAPAFTFHQSLSLFVYISMWILSAKMCWCPGPCLISVAHAYCPWSAWGVYWSLASHYGHLSPQSSLLNPQLLLCYVTFRQLSLQVFDSPCPPACLPLALLHCYCLVSYCFFKERQKWT